ncbi:glycosyltransferase [Antrihabitans sp. YC2-6]|uniref:glycosyltransferase n=1 Tax=Antrihabitans sp. YC2-6 TaxID=2799498 RepID=UPI0018F2E1C1|nr:glycosyltransferase [Antrihabitans sp. YC2-6]MBJ8348705.1 glycosyltransferase [Antrihabitans sp. YC2-6]
MSPLPSRDSAAASHAGDGVAVVMVTHNGAEFLAAQLASIVAQKPPPAAVYLVDDGSADGSPKLVREFFARHPGIPLTVIPAPRRRGRDLYTRIARNFAAGLSAAAPFGFIALADQDDIWPSDRLARQRQRLEETGALLTTGNGELIDRDGRSTGRTLRDRFPVTAGWPTAGPGARMRAVMKQPMTTGAASMIRSELLDLALPVPAGWLHDRWFSLVAVARAGLDVDPATALYYRTHEQQAVGVRGHAGRTGRERIADAVLRPYFTIRKVRDVSFTLRGKAVDPAIRAELRLGSVLRSYLGR